MPKKRLAIFDIDGTIFRSSLLIELVDALIYEGIFKPGAAKIYERDKKKWLDRKGGYEAYIASVVKAFRKNLKDVRYGDFLRVANTVVALHKNRVYRFTRDLVSDLKKKGYYLTAISHSPRLIVGPFAEKMGFDKVYGFRYEIDSQKKFTGEARPDDPILDKAKILERILEKEPVTLHGSVGVGDTESDIPFLKLVDNPICFNPNKKLFDAAKKSGWQVIVERKDVIYRMR
jgi:HAD superfamily hydrolase (TIGR01490 family)